MKDFSSSICTNFITKQIHLGFNYCGILIILEKSLIIWLLVDQIGGALFLISLPFVEEFL
jgi:hypothetical protein